MEHSLFIVFLRLLYRVNSPPQKSLLVTIVTIGTSVQVYEDVSSTWISEHFSCMDLCSEFSVHLHAHSCILVT
jgi:hypothetical protein